MEQLIDTLRQQATKTLASLQEEIAKREQELADLKAEAERWQSMLGEKPKAATLSPAPRPAQAAPQPRLDWNAILKELPATFTAKDVAEQSNKPLQSVYTRVFYWVRTGKVTKTKSGYQKTGTRTSA